MTETLTVVSPTSVETWYAEFADREAGVLFVGEKPDDQGKITSMILEASAGRLVKIHSGHDSLLRDYAIAKDLRSAGVSVEAQSGLAAAAGVDKVLQKRVLEYAGIRVPKWGIARDLVPLDARILRKGRDSTQSRGLEWDDTSATLSADTYWEEYVQGTEYSVVLYRDGQATNVFPVIWKGENRLDLLPPWRRLRTVPAGMNDTASHVLTETSRKVADLFDVWGFMEVEFIVPPEGSPLVIDVNPRICGTMRLVAMATGVPIFDRSAFPSSTELLVTAIHHVAELPYEGPPFVTPDVIATSRVTCRASGPSAARELLGKWSASNLLTEARWPAGWA